MSVLAPRLLQPLLGECRVHKEPDPLGVHQLLLSAKGWRIITKNGDVLHMTLEGRIACKSLTPGFVRLQILEGVPTQIEHEIDRAVLAGQALNKAQCLGSSLLCLLLVNRAGDTMQHGRRECWRT